MAAMLFTWVFLQAVLLWEVHCKPVKNGLAPVYKVDSTGSGSSKATAFYPPEEQVPPGYDVTYLPGPEDQDGYDDIHDPPSSTSQEISWVIPPRLFSTGERGLSASNAGSWKTAPGSSYASPPEPQSGPKFIPGELVLVESALEDGGYESQTEERAFLPPYGYGEEVFTRPPEVSNPRGSAEFNYPYDWLFLRGQYPIGASAHWTSSVAPGRDDWAQNHYIRYDYPASLFEEQPVQTFTSASDQSFQMPGPDVESWPGQQETAAYPYLSRSIGGGHLIRGHVAENDYAHSPKTQQFWRDF